MSGWSRVRLGDCCEIVSGATPDTSSDEFWGGDICWVTPKDLSGLQGHFISDTPRKLTATGLASCSAATLPPNSVLFSSRAPIGHVAINTVPMATNQGFKSFIPGPTVDAKFLFRWLRANRPFLENLGVGATFKEVSKSIVANVQIPLPPLPEQRRIASILDKADALRVKRREALAQLDRLAQAIFVEMFGDPMSPEGRWRPVPVSDFVAGFESGKSVAAEDEDDPSSRFRVLKVSAVTSLDFKPYESKAAPVDHVPQDSHFVRRGDLLFSRANTMELIGATAYVSDTPDDLLLPDKLWRFVWHGEPLATPQFVNYLFRQPKFRAEIGRRASGSSGSMKNISQEKVMSIEVALPPLSMQQEFSHRIEKLILLKKAHSSAAEASDALFASLQHRAFRGAL